METLRYPSKDLTLILNICPHYREPIFRLIEKNWDCRWIFGENKTDIPSCDTSFMHSVKTLPLTKGKVNTWWLKGLRRILHLSSSKDIIMTGEIKFLGSWYVMISNRLRPRSRRARIFLWSHGWNGTEKNVRNVFYRLYFGMADGLLLYGDHSRNIALKEGIDPSRIHVIHNSLDHDRFINIRHKMASGNSGAMFFRQWFENPSCPTLVYIGRLSLIKKLQQLFEAVAILKAKGRECNIAIIGEGPDKDTLLRTCSDLRLKNNIHFFGPIYDLTESAPIIYNSDICVSPGHIGLTAIHALELGTPVVTHSDFSAQAPEAETVIPGQTGQLFEKNNVEDLAKAISRQLDRNEAIGRDAVRNTCYEAIESWTPEWQLERFKTALE